MPSKAKVTNSVKGKADYITLPFVTYQRDLDKGVLSQFNYVINGTSKDIDIDYHLPPNKPLKFD